MSNQFDSNEELHFSWYLDELKSKGYIIEWSKVEKSFELTKGLYLNYKIPMKKVDDKIKQQTILSPSVYTPDFYIIWSVKAFGIFTTDIDMDSDNKLDTPFISRGKYSTVEVKGTFDNNNMTRLAVNNIKFVYDKFGVYVNLIKVPTIFDKTFTPDRYIMTDKSFKPRTINYKNVRTLRGFVQSLSK